MNSSILQMTSQFHHLTMSSSKNINNKNHALNLSRYIKMESEKRISAGEGWPKYWDQSGIDKGALKPKALCAEFPDILQWTADPTAPGLGWISCASNGRGASTAASKGHAAASKVHHNQGQLVKSHGGSSSSVAVATQMADIFKSLQNLSFTTDSQKKEAVIRGEKEKKREVVGVQVRQGIRTERIRITKEEVEVKVREVVTYEDVPETGDAKKQRGTRKGH